MVVLIAVVIHSTLGDLGRKKASRSFVAFERSIDPTRSKSKLPVRTQVQNGHTKGVASNVERFEGMRAPLHQRRHQRDIFPAFQIQCELPEVDTAWYGQQSMGNKYHPPAVVVMIVNSNLINLVLCCFTMADKLIECDFHHPH